MRGEFPGRIQSVPTPHVASENLQASQALLSLLCACIEADCAAVWALLPTAARVLSSPAMQRPELEPVAGRYLKPRNERNELCAALASAKFVLLRARSICR